METSTPVNSKPHKGRRPKGSADNVVNISPITEGTTSAVICETGAKRSSKRARKPRTWDDFEVGNFDTKSHSTANESLLNNSEKLADKCKSALEVDKSAASASDSKMGPDISNGSDKHSASFDTPVTSTVEVILNCDSEAKVRKKSRKHRRDTNCISRSLNVVNTKQTIKEKIVEDNNIAIDTDAGNNTQITSKVKDTNQNMSANFDLANDWIKPADANEVRHLKNMVNSVRNKSSKCQKQAASKCIYGNTSGDSNLNGIEHNLYGWKDSGIGHSNSYTLVDNDQVTGGSVDTRESIPELNNKTDDVVQESGIDSIEHTSVDGSIDRVIANVGNKTPTLKQRGRPTKFNSIENVHMENDAKLITSLSDMSSNSIQENNTSVKKKRRQKEASSLGLDGTDTAVKGKEQDKEIPKILCRSGRKCKVVKNEAFLDDSESEEVIQKKKRKKKATDSEDAIENDDINDTKESSTVCKQKTGSNTKKDEEICCLKCDFVTNVDSNMQKHAAVAHQLWWTREKPEGQNDRSVLLKIIRLKKFLNCEKCGKQINFITYYPQHVEWCGRELEKYTCEYCKKNNLKLQWKHIHMKSCPVLRLLEEQQLQKQQAQEKKDVMEVGAKTKRKAAKKAMSLVQNLSKDKGSSAESDDESSDVKWTHEQEGEDNNDDDEIDDDDDELDEITDEDEILDKDHNSEDDDDFCDDEEDRLARKLEMAQGFQSFFTYSMMELYMKENLSETLYANWLPRKDDWQILKPREIHCYLPKECQSAFFTMSRDAEPELHSMELYQSMFIDGFPVFYTGLVVWHVAWCPVPLHCTDVQYLAVAGQHDLSISFLVGKRQAVPCVVQIWNTGITSTGSSDVIPKLCYNLVHDFGLVTELQWCPSGCYKTTSSKSDGTTYSRLGLLAMSLTDASIRIFSLPLLPESDHKSVPTLKANPVVTLIPFITYEKHEFTCCCMDWINVKGHSKIVAGYSNGRVSVYNVSSPSPFTRVPTSSDSNHTTLLPVISFQPHGSKISAVRWCANWDHIISTTTNDVETAFWDLNNLNLPLSTDKLAFMGIAMASSLWQSGVFVASDDNMALNWNKSRYVEISNLSYRSNGKRVDKLLRYNFAAQNACVWDISYSNWLNYVVTCDSMGCICAMILKDMTVHAPDAKTYPHRQLLLETTVVEIQENLETKKAKLLQSDLTQDVENISMQSNSGLSKPSDQSKSVSHKNKKSKGNKVTKKIPTGNKNTSDGIKSGVSNEVAAQKYYQYLEYFQDAKRGSNIYPGEDEYDVVSGKAIKTIALNPNHRQCYWMAYGGDIGLIRLVNVKQLLPRNIVTQIDKL